MGKTFSWLSPMNFTSLEEKTIAATEVILVELILLLGIKFYLHIKD